MHFATKCRLPAWRLCLTLLFFSISSLVFASGVNSEGPPESDLYSLSVQSSDLSAGYFQLGWQSVPDAEYQLRQLLPEQHWSVGAVDRFTMTGLGDGDYQYQVRQISPEILPWSPPLSVAVAHHSLATAGSYFALGLLLFVVLLIALFRPSAEEPA